MSISIHSRKAKGRNLQKHVVARILHYFEWLKPDDVTSRSMGSGGEDILLSPKARKALPISLECKNNKQIAVYKFYEQAQQNAKDYEPVVVIKQNNARPLALVDLDVFLMLAKETALKNNFRKG